MTILHIDNIINLQRERTQREKKQKEVESQQHEECCKLFKPFVQFFNSIAACPTVYDVSLYHTLVPDCPRQPSTALVFTDSKPLNGFELWAGYSLEDRAARLYYRDNSNDDSHRISVEDAEELLLRKLADVIVDLDKYREDNKALPDE